MKLFLIFLISFFSTSLAIANESQSLDFTIKNARIISYGGQVIPFYFDNKEMAQYQGHIEVSYVDPTTNKIETKYIWIWSPVANPGMYAVWNFYSIKRLNQFANEAFENTQESKSLLADIPDPLLDIHYRMIDGKHAFLYDYKIATPTNDAHDPDCKAKAESDREKNITARYCLKGKPQSPMLPEKMYSFCNQKWTFEGADCGEEAEESEIDAETSTGPEIEDNDSGETEL